MYQINIYALFLPLGYLLLQLLLFQATDYKSQILRRYPNRSIFSGFAQKLSLISVRFLQSSLGSLRNGRNLGKTESENLMAGTALKRKIALVNLWNKRESWNWHRKFLNNDFSNLPRKLYLFLRRHSIANSFSCTYVWYTLCDIWYLKLTITI